ncbi:MAG: flagellar protein FlaG [Pseudomonadota bacterium]
MSIQSIGSPTARTADKTYVAEVAPPPAAAPDTRVAVEKAAPAPTLEQVTHAVANINKSLQTLSQDLEFSVDHDSNRTIVKVIDKKTKDVIRQIPSPETLEIAKALDTVKGLLIRQTA